MKEMLGWFLLLPAVFLTWCACTIVVLGLSMLCLWTSFGLNEWLMSFSSDFTRFAIIGLPTVIITGVAEFFVTRAIAPKHKICIACITTILSVVCTYYMLWGLNHLAY